MTKQLRNLTSIVVVGLFASASGVALASGIETQHSIYDLAAQMNATQMHADQTGQAGRAGPDTMDYSASGFSARNSVSVETQFSIYNLANRS